MLSLRKSCIDFWSANYMAIILLKSATTRWNAITLWNRQARRMMILVEVMKMLLVVGVEGMWSRVTFQSDLGQAGHRGHRPPILPDKILNTQHTRRPAKITRRATEKTNKTYQVVVSNQGFIFTHLPRTP